MRSLVCGLLFFALTVSAVPAPAGPLATPADTQAALDAFVAKAPGVVVIAGVIDRDGRHVYMAGTPLPGAPALNERTEFEIGSISKTFTATLLAQMAGAGEVKLSDPVAAYLPGVHVPTFNGKAITLETLADQHSGLPAWPGSLAGANPADPFAGVTDADADALLAKYSLTREPGAAYEYSNYGFSLLGEALAHRAKVPYQGLLKARVLDPLDMDDTAVALDPARSARLMPGFSEDLTPKTAWSNSFIAPAGLIRSDMHDMLQFLGANMAAPSGPLGSAMTLAHTVRADISSAPPLGIGLAWMTNTASHIVFHNGQTGGYHSFIGFDPSSGTGVVVLTNVASFSVDQLALHVLYPSVPAPSPIEHIVPHGSSPFIGVYHLTPAFAITIFEEAGTLYEQATGQIRLPLKLVSGTTFAVGGVDATITFERDASGKVTALVLHQNGADQRAPRSPR